MKDRTSVEAQQRTTPFFQTNVLSSIRVMLSRCPSAHVSRQA